MIADDFEYGKANEELEYLQEWLARLRSETTIADRGLTKAGIRKMIARLHEELAVYEGTTDAFSKANTTTTEDRPALMTTS